MPLPYNSSLSEEQNETNAHIFCTLKGQHKALFEALWKHHPDPLSQPDLATILKTDERSVGVFKSELKYQKLEAFYKSEDAKRVGWRVGIETMTGRGETPHGYYLTFETNSGFHLRRFWYAYLKRTTPPVKTRISFTVLRFFRNFTDRFFFRHLDINDDTRPEQVDALANTVPALAATLNHKTFADAKKEDRIHDINFFTTTGEMQCILLLREMLQTRDAHNDYSSNDQLEELVRTDHNLLILGNKRTHPAVRQMQGDPDYRHYTQNWRWRIAEKGIEPISEGKAYLDTEKMVYALLTRIPPTSESNRVVTIIAANHSMAFAGLGETLTSEEHLNSLFKQLHWANEAPLPARFQLIFSVRIDSSERKIGTGATFIAAHPEQWPLGEKLPDTTS
jgi:hypothetical protein